MGERRSVFQERILLLMLAILILVTLLRVLRWVLHLLGR